MATEIRAVTSTVFDVSASNGQKFIGSTVVETADEDSQDKLMYSMQTLRVITTNNA